jgi:hypothetical protein
MLIDAAWTGDCSLDSGDTGLDCDRILIEDLSHIGQFGWVEPLIEVTVDGVAQSLSNCFTTNNLANVGHYYVECPFP